MTKQLLRQNIWCMVISPYIREVLTKVQYFYMKNKKSKNLANQLTFDFGALIGSEKAKKGKAKLAKPFLNRSTFVCPWISLKKQKQTQNVAMSGRKQ